MTFAEYLIGRSGLPSGTATLMEHLEAIQGTGGGDVYINSEIVEITQNDAILLTQLNEVVEISPQPIVSVDDLDTEIKIIQVEDEIDVVCEV